VVGVVILFDFFRLLWLGVALAVLLIATVVLGFRDGTSNRLRYGTLGLLIVALLLLPQVLLIVAQPPNATIIDGALLNDVAADRLLSGHDPYVGDFVNTPMRAFYIPDSPVNFGLSRFVYMPGMALLDVPLRLLHNDRVNFSLLYLPALLGLVAAAWSLGMTTAGKQAAVIVVALNPLFQIDYFSLLNDLFFLAPALAGVGLLRRGRPLAAGALLGLSLGMKQQAILFLPLLALYAVLHLDRRDLLRLAAAGALVVGVIVLPFLVWDPKAFLAGTTGFFYGSGVDSYPIRGIGLQGILLGTGVIRNRWDSFPTAQIQVPLLVIALVLAIRDLRRSWSWTRYWAWLGLEALIVFAFGRVLSPNYLDLVVTFVLLAVASALVGDAPGLAVERDVEGTASGGGPIGAVAEHDPGHLPAL
jgi:hypothetical protein